MLTTKRYFVVGRYGYIWGEFKTKAEARARCNKACGDRIATAKLVPVGRSSADAFRIAQGNQ